MAQHSNHPATPCDPLDPAHSAEGSGAEPGAVTGTQGADETGHGGTTREGGAVSPRMPDLSRLAPRLPRSESFEQNPRSVAPSAVPGNSSADRLEMDDGTRVREALRGVIEQGESVQDAARDWNVAPSSIREWRTRYRDLLEDAAPLTEENHGLKDAGLIYIPESAREMFTENWDRLVTETAAEAADFRQSPGQIFLQTSPVTSWLFHDGQLDRGILAGALSGMIVLAILASFLLADRNPAVVAVVALPEVLQSDEANINEAAAVAQSFFKAANWEERLKFVRQPDAMREMVQAYYQDHPDGPINDVAISLAMADGKLVNLSFDVPSLNRPHFLCLVKSKGHFAVDWESSSLYQEVHLTQLRALRSTGITRIAVTVNKNEEANYYNYAFRDADRWVCYKLSYPGLNLNLFGYAAKDASDFSTLEALLGNGNQRAVLLEVRFPPDAKSDNQVEIVRVLRDEWVPVDP